MSRSIRYAMLFLLLLLPGHSGFAEKVANLPAPTGYVSDFAGVLSAETVQNVDALCTQVDHQAGAQMAVVTIKTLDDDQTVEEFTVELEEKWKVGKKGTDKGLLLVIVLNPRKVRTEVGYGLEGVLNDAKVGRIQQTMVPLLSQGNYDAGVATGIQAYAKEIAADAGVTLAPIGPQYAQHQYRREAVGQGGSGVGGLIGIGIIVVLVILMIATGNGGWIWFIISMLMNGGGGRGGRGGGFGGGGGDGGGGFGGFGGGSSGGGGNTSDY